MPNNNYVFKEDGINHVNNELINKEVTSNECEI